MEEMNGTISQKVVPIGPSEAHLQNKLVSKDCYICKKPGKDSVLIRYKDNDMVMACEKHPGVTQEFVRQFQRPPLGWVKEE